MTSKNQLGKLGEDLACRFLVYKGFKILERNFRKPWGELDIIAKSPDKTLVFVEVKTMRQFGNDKLPDYDGITSEMQMTGAKIKKTKRAASLYAGNYPEFVDDKKGWRIDLLALTMNGENYVIKHYENI